MQVQENRTLFSENILSYKCSIPRNNILKMADFICSNVSVLGVKTTHEPIFYHMHTNDKADGTVNIEFFIPINSVLESRAEYSFMSDFGILDAITVRHEGSFSELQNTEKNLKKYISEHDYEAMTDFYYSIVHNDTPNDTNHIIDIYVSVKDKN
ncbi:MAG: hypothetical protein IJP18_00965 [Oscillospiraceae bacterium]|nr:hypothetical protein [Oscillospiraceae bacterium]MBQ9981112.1 hypothetical protein [Oscillospiraceae bacterium]